MAKEVYLDIEWTTLRLNKQALEVNIRNNGNGPFEDIKLPLDMQIWLHNHTGDRQSSMIREAEWWWDSKQGDDTSVQFYFRDPNVALQFKLTWGSGELSA